MSGYAQALRLVDAPGFRAIRRALRGTVRRFDPPEEADGALVEVVDRPFESVAGAADRLSRLETRLLDREDRRAVFLTIYARMTGEVRAGIDSGTFGDPAWMERYLVTFANYYRRAFLAFERGDLAAVPDPWRVAFGAAVDGDALLVQDAFLGVNAHINYDLALALADVGTEPDRAQKYADHAAVDGILARLVDAQQAALARIYAAGVSDVDALFGRLDEAFTALALTRGREQAWRTAIVLTDVDVPPVPSYARWVLRTTATGGAFLVLDPPLDARVVRALRAVETDGLDIEAVTERVRNRFDGDS